MIEADAQAVEARWRLSGALEGWKLAHSGTLHVVACTTQMLEFYQHRSLCGFSFNEITYWNWDVRICRSCLLAIALRKLAAPPKS
ncbi:hypothetical protein LCGC14_0772120 [marine sediment metagenome]|uniref:Uncharacterized protein n=1 Tax=marine sediment metagenome TaxID=412755 RepID=A0A0F9Q245_9ZZZZ